VKIPGDGDDDGGDVRFVLSETLGNKFPPFPFAVAPSGIFNLAILVKVQHSIVSLAYKSFKSGIVVLVEICAAATLLP